MPGEYENACSVSGNCFSNLDYQNNEFCEWTIHSAGTLSVIQWEIEGSPYDYLSIGGTYYGDSNFGPEGVVVVPGMELVWTSDGSVTKPGFEICVEQGDQLDCSSLHTSLCTLLLTSLHIASHLTPHLTKLR